MTEILMVLLILAALVAAAIIYEDRQMRSDVLKNPPPGSQIELSGRCIHMYPMGEGTPVVVLDAGLGDSCLVWSVVQPEVAQITRVISYDRAGIGWSDSGPKPRTYQRAAEELHTLLDSSGEKGPYVLVGHSAGVNSIRLFAQSYPAEVAGLILIEPPILSRVSPFLVNILRGMRYVVYILSKLGFVRFLGRRSLMRLLFAGVNPPAEISKHAGFLYRPESIRASIDEIDALPDTIRLLDQSVHPGAWYDWPIVIIVAHQDEKSTTRDEDPFEELARLSTNGRVISLKGSHFVHFEHPNVVVQAIREVVEAMRP